MAEYSVPQNEPRRFEPMGTNTPSATDVTTVAQGINVASPAPLGLGILAFATAVLGCFYTGFIIPYQGVGMRPAVGAISIVMGIILVLAGMWEFRKNSAITATVFTSYGGFLAMLGLLFMPNFGIFAALGGNLPYLLGLVYLCWTIYLAVLCIGSSRASASLTITLVLMLVAFFFLMLGELAGSNGVLVRIGGWFAIATGLVGWLASVASIVSVETRNAAYRIPFGRRLAVVE